MNELKVVARVIKQLPDEKVECWVYQPVETGAGLVTLADAQAAIDKLQAQVKHLTAEVEAANATVRDSAALLQTKEREVEFWQKDRQELQQKDDAFIAELSKDAERWRMLNAMRQADEKQGLVIAWYDVHAPQRISGLAGRDPIAIIDAAIAAMLESKS